MMNNKVKPMVQGAFLAAFNGVLGVLNIYLGQMFDVMFAYVMVLPMVYYSKHNRLSNSLLVMLVSFFVLFMVGELFFMLFATACLMMGVFYGEALKREWSKKRTFYGLTFLSAIKNGIIFFLLGELLGLSVFEEGIEIYEMMVGWIPIFNEMLSSTVVFVILWILVFLSEAKITMFYSDLFLHRIEKHNYKH